jgi:hypothetical protein
MDLHSPFSGGSSNEPSRKTFLNHVFSTTEEGKAELLNVIQYTVLAIIPIVILNKTIQKIIPEANPDKSSLEITFEVIAQLITIFVGIVVIHRIITFIPTYSGFKYDSLILTNVILAFLVIVLSIQTKVGIKTSILVDRLGELWNGPTAETNKTEKKKSTTSSESDYSMFQQAPTIPPEKQAAIYDQTMRGSPESSVRGSSAPQTFFGSGSSSAAAHDSGPLPANGLLGGSFGSSF